MKKTLIALVVSLAAATPALPITIGFEGIAASGGATNYNSSGPSESGFNFMLSHGHVIDSGYPPGTYQTSNGTDWLMHDSTGSMTMDMGGGAFSLQRLDFGNFSFSASTVNTVTVIGQLSGGGTVSQVMTNIANFATFAFSGWTDLVSVSFTGSGYGAYDNIVVNEHVTSAVPTPATLPLLAGAIGLIGIARRRRPK